MRKVLFIPALVAIIALSACGGGESVTETTAPTTTSAPGGDTTTTAVDPGPAAPAGEIVSLTATLGSEIWLHPWTEVSASQALQPMFETLLERDPETGALIQGTGRLAETWSVNEDFTEYTFNLRRGVQFHKGWGEMTSADVLFSFNLYTREDGKGATGAVYRANVDRVETPDDYTVVFHMKQPYPDFPQTLTENVFVLGIASKAYYDAVGEEEVARAPVGTGPFEFSEHVLGEYIRFTAVEDHWRVTPDVETLTIRAVPDEATRIGLLERGDAHISTIAYDSIARLEGAGVKILSIPEAQIPTIYLGGQFLNPTYDPANTPPWAPADDENARKVRKAMSLALDRQEIIDFVMAGRGTTSGACVSSWFPNNIGHDPNCDADPHDPDEAMRLLAEAGYDDPSQISITVNLARHPTTPYAADILEAAAQQWQNFGFTVNFIQDDWAAVTEVIGNRSATFAFGYAPPRFFDAAGLLAVYSRSTDRISFTGESEELDRLLGAALAAYVPAEVEATRAELFAYLRDGTFNLPVGYADIVFGMAPNLEWSPLPGVGGTHRFEYMTLTDNN